MRRILLLTDYRGAFYSTVGTQRTACTMDVPRIVRIFGRAGYEVEVQRFADVDLTRDFRGMPILYTSSEDPELLYKSYIEDIILALQHAGAELIPRYQYLRAHHNKSMMEALRYHLFPKEAERLGTRCYGTYEELASDDLGTAWPKVIKSAYGAGSAYVASAPDRAALLRIAKSYSRAVRPSDITREYRRRLLWRNYQRRSLSRRKFVVQNMIPGLAGDFKVLRFGKRYYRSYRHNRPGDFRASGSGVFTGTLPAEVDETALLDHAEWVAETIGTPLISLDICFDGTDFRLIEFQCLHFGTITAESSTHYHTRVDGRWAKVTDRCDVESVFCDAMVSHIEKRADAISL